MADDKGNANPLNRICDMAGSDNKKVVVPKSLFTSLLALQRRQ